MCFIFICFFYIAIEKLNSDAKSMFLSSNKHDSTKAIVLKKEHLSVSTERRRRRYTRREGKRMVISMNPYHTLVSTADPNDYCFMYS